MALRWTLRKRAVRDDLLQAPCSRTRPPNTEKASFALEPSCLARQCRIENGGAFSFPQLSDTVPLRGPIWKGRSTLREGSNLRGPMRLPWIGSERPDSGCKPLVDSLRNSPRQSKAPPRQSG